jgi:hypothetical protein
MGLYFKCRCVTLSKFTALPYRTITSTDCRYFHGSSVYETNIIDERLLLGQKEDDR